MSIINAYGSLEYLMDQIRQQEAIKTMKNHGETEGWEINSWSDQEEERLNLLSELVKYRKLYYAVEKKLEDDLK